MPPRKRRPKGSGSTNQLPSGRWRAVHTGPDGLTRTAGKTFDTKLDATAWLDAQTKDARRGSWEPPESRKATADTFEGYSDEWLAGRELKPRTRALYADLLDKVINPDLGPRRLDRITPAVIRTWYGGLNAATPTRRAHAYALVRTILGTAVIEDLIPSNPCKIVGAGSERRAKTIRPATLDELEVIVGKMPEHLRLLTLLSAWCALPFGEATELRRKDVDVDNGLVRIRRGVTHVGGQYIVGTPKSTAGIRDVHVPPHLMPLVKAHLTKWAQPGPEGLLFPAASGDHLATATLYRWFYAARKAAGRDDLTWHGLRHTGAVLAASTGASLAEMMSRLGHSTPAAALLYQQAAAHRDQAIATKLSELASNSDV